MQADQTMFHNCSQLRAIVCVCGLVRGCVLFARICVCGVLNWLVYVSCYTYKSLLKHDQYREDRQYCVHVHPSDSAPFALEVGWTQPDDDHCRLPQSRFNTFIIVPGLVRHEMVTPRYLQRVRDGVLA